MEPNKNYRIFNEEIEFKLKEISDWLGLQLPPGWGFTLLLSSLGPDSQLFYMTTIRKEDVVATLKALVEAIEKEQQQLPPEPAK